jgi:hypothetical protein
MKFFGSDRLSWVLPPVVTVHLSARIRSSSRIGRGVVVTSTRGLGPALRPICKFAQLSSGRRHLASSSAQAK